MEKEARREVGRDERSGIICRKEIFDRKPYIVPNRIMIKCELRDVMYTSPFNQGGFVFLTAKSTLPFDTAYLVR